MSVSFDFIMYPPRVARPAIYTWLGLWRFRPECLWAGLPKDVAKMIAKAIGKSGGYLYQLYERAMSQDRWYCLIFDTRHVRVGDDVFVIGSWILHSGYDSMKHRWWVRRVEIEQWPRCCNCYGPFSPYAQVCLYCHSTGIAPSLLEPNGSPHGGS